MTRIYVPIMHNDTIENLIRKTSSVWNQKQVDLEFDLSNCNFAKPEILLVATVLYNILLKRGKLSSINIKQPLNKDVHTYASRINFYKLLNHDFQEHFQRHDPYGRFVEITQTTDDNQDRIVSNVSEIIKSNFDLNFLTLFTIHYCLTEIIGNVHCHAYSDIGGWVVAQNYKNRVEICIADGGIGIKNSLRMNSIYASVNDVEALAEAVKDLVTRSEDKSKGMGRGLYITSKLLEENGGILEIYSGNACLRKYAASQQIDESSFWPGTIVRMCFQKNKKLDEATLKSILHNSVMLEDALTDRILW